MVDASTDSLELQGEGIFVSVGSSFLLKTAARVGRRDLGIMTDR
jgi:hypothetical protein